MFAKEHPVPNGTVKLQPVPRFPSQLRMQHEPGRSKGICVLVTSPVSSGIANNRDIP